MKTGLSILLICCFVTACGGGSSGKKTTAPPVVAPPVVEAPADSGHPDVPPETELEPELEQEPEPEQTPGPEPKPDRVVAYEQAVDAALLREAEADIPELLSSHFLMRTNPVVARLKLIDGSELEAFIKNGLRIDLTNSHYQAFPEVSHPLGDDGGIDFSASPFPENYRRFVPPEQYSGTNTRVSGVDEADVAKYDGHYWFVWRDTRNNLSSAGIDILAVDPVNAGLAQVGGVDLPGQVKNRPDNFYLYQHDLANTLVALQVDWGNVYPVAPRAQFFSWKDSPISGKAFPEVENSTLNVRLYNLDDPAQPEPQAIISVDGSLIDSRRIGNHLYVITRFDPWVPGLEYGSHPWLHHKNLLTINTKRLSDLMPKYHINGVSRPLSMHCHVPEYVVDAYGSRTVIHITTIDLDVPGVIDSQCVSADLDVISMTEDSLYMAAGTIHASREKTQIYKFKLVEGGVDYVATGTVDGHIDQRSDPALRLHEYNNDLRVVTTGSAGAQRHKLTILEHREDALRVVATLPNKHFPATIGRPQDDIYAVRFTPTRAYISTYKSVVNWYYGQVPDTVDPLYVIDLSDRTNPHITGQLEFPGTLNYIHPVNDDYILTIGPGAGAIYPRAQLIRIGDGIPEMQGNLVFDEFYHSNAFDDLKALSFLWMGENELRVVMPMTSYETSGLALMTLSGLDNDAASLDLQDIVSFAKESNRDPRVHRAVIHGDRVLYAFGRYFWSGHWHDPHESGSDLTLEP